MSSIFTWCIDGGHAGVLRKAFDPSKLKSPMLHDGSEVTESQFARRMTDRLMELLREHRIYCVDIVSGCKITTTATVRLNRIAKVHQHYKACCYLNVSASHGDAPEQELMAKPNSVTSKEMAQLVLATMSELGNNYQQKTEILTSDIVRYSELYMLRHIEIPGLTIKPIHMDNIDSIYRIKNDSEIDRIAKEILQCILRIEQFYGNQSIFIRNE